MGDLLSRIEERLKEREKEELENFVMRLPEGPDLRVSRSIKMFTSLESSDNLRQHYETRKMEAGDVAADLIKNLVDKLADLKSAPQLAGLGALAVAVFIDVITFSPPEESTKDALRCVFAEEKASEVWDQIDECLKRCTMHINDDDELRSNISRIECQLSAALTKLKNSMVKDGHMTSPALKAWVNGAAFHVQMLIHLVRLGGIQTCDPVERILSVYQSDLDTLFKEHKEMIRKKCYMRVVVLFDQPVHYLIDEDSMGHVIDPKNTYDEYFEAYYEHRYSRQWCESLQYFSDVRQNLQQLVDQRGSFNVSPYLHHTASSWEDVGSP
ncbi:hypothetical protein ABVT39_003457 [Epinephelus coioides]